MTGKPSDDFAGDPLREKLRSAAPPVGRLEPGRDLWPSMLRRMEKTPLQVPWFDWVLLALTGAALFFFPALVPALLYHF